MILEDVPIFDFIVCFIENYFGFRLKSIDYMRKHIISQEAFGKNLVFRLSLIDIIILIFLLEFTILSLACTAPSAVDHSPGRIEYLY